MQTDTSVLRQNLKRINPLIVLAPLIYAFSVAYFILMDDFDFKKSELENFAYFILVPFAVISFIRFCAERRTFFLWLTAFLGTLICREVHFTGTDVGVFAGLAGLFAIAKLKYDAIKDGFSTPIFLNLVTACLFCYFLSEAGLDKNWARLSDEVQDKYSFASRLEETIELLGHFLIGISVVLIPSRLSGETPTSQR